MTLLTLLSEQYEAACDLYLKRALTKEALECARKTGKKTLIGHTLLVDAIVSVRKHERHKDPASLEEICANLDTAFNIFQNNEKKDEAGEAALLRGQITGKREFINKSFGAFENAMPMNDAGKLECMNWMVKHSDLFDQKNMRQVIKGMENLFTILRVLVRQKDGLERSRAERILKFYGLTLSGDSLTLSPQQKPMALKMLRRIMSENDRRSVRFEKPWNDVVPEICKFLVKRGLDWKKRIEEVLNKIRDSKKQCPHFAIGRPCRKSEVEADDSDEYLSADEYQSEREASFNKAGRKCPHFHAPFTNKRHNALLDVDEEMIELDFYVHHGTRDLEKTATEDLKKDVQRFVPTNFEEKYKSCVNFIGDLLPNRCFLSIVTDTPTRAKDLKSWFNSRRFWFKDHFQQYLFDLYSHMLKHERMWNTRVFVRLIFLSQLLDLKLSGNNKPIAIMNQFEGDIQREFTRKESINAALPLGFFKDEYLEMRTGERVIRIECIAHRFYDSFDKLSGLNNDPKEALVAFSKFMTMLRGKNSPMVKPYYNEFIFWLEFYVTVALSLIAKTYVGENFLYVLPESYISSVHFVDASFIQKQGVPTFEAIQRFQAWRNFDYNLFPTRLEYIIAILFRETWRDLNLIKYLFQTSARDGYLREKDYAVAERVLVLSLVCLCNVGHGVSADVEVQLMQQLCRIRIRDAYPPRLVSVLRAIQQASSPRDLASALGDLLKEREGEDLLLCEWRKSVRNGIVKHPMKLETLNDSFYHEETHMLRSNPFQAGAGVGRVDEDQKDEMQEDVSITMEERMKRDRQMKDEEARLKTESAAKCIARSVKLFVLRKRMRRLRSLVEKEITKEKQQRRTTIFQSCFITETWCGICGVAFKTCKEASDATEKSGDILVMREQTADGDWLSRPNPTLPVDGAGDNMETRKEHEESINHKDRVKANQLFRFKFQRELSDDYEKVIDFINKYKLSSTTMTQTYPNYSYSIDRMVRVCFEATSELQRIVIEKDWGNSQRFIEKVKEMKEDFMQVQGYVEETAKANKKVRYTPIMHFEILLSSSQNLLKAADHLT